MPPIKTQISCPQCRMPVVVTLEQLFDATQDPAAKNRFLSGRFNFIDCPNCHYQGQAATPILYHDADKELLMSFVPMELGLPQAEQEKIIGKLMNEVVNKLPMEKRKGYLLNPKPAFTLQGLIDRVLEGEGITKEMMEAQRAKIQLVQKFIQTPEDQWAELATANDAQMDAEFFQLITASAEATAQAGNQAGAQTLLTLQNKLVKLSSYGAKLVRQQATLKAAADELQALGEGLTRDKLLELMLNADDEKAVAFVSLARQGLDYAFFEALTRRVDRAQGADRERLTHLREVLLQATAAIDQAMQAQMNEASTLLRSLLDAPDLEAALQESLPAIDDTFMAVLNANVEAAQKAGPKGQEVLQRLNQIGDAIAQLLEEAAPPEIKFINELMEIESEAEATAALKQRSADITPQLISAMNYIEENLRRSGQTEMADRLERLRGVALGESMAANWKK
jgi:hypothetical protein